MRELQSGCLMCSQMLMHICRGFFWLPIHACLLKVLPGADRPILNMQKAEV